MNTMFKHRILAVALFFTTLLGFSSCVENGERDLQVDNKTLYEVIAADNTLSDFWEIVNACSIEGRDFADSLFNHARVYTVWAPVNGSFDKEYWLNQIDEERENVVQTFVFSHVANHLRPANGELEKGNLVIMLNNKMASFEGSYKTKKYSFGGCEIFDSNQRVWNGLLHKLSGASEYRYNIWEFLKAGPEKMDGFSVDSVAKFLYSHNITEFSPGASILAPSGLTYIDSVFETTNRWLNVYGGIGPVDAEDSVYTIYVPTDDVWEEMVEKAKKYYRYDIAMNKPQAMDTAYIDSLANHYPTFNVLKYITYSQNEQRYASNIETDLEDPVMPAYRGGNRKVFSSAQMEANVVFEKELSNGVFKVVNKMPYTEFELWHDTIKIEVENTEMGYYRQADAHYYHYVSENQLNDIFKGTGLKLSGERYYEGYSEENQVTVKVKLPNILSAKYKIAMIVVPKHITNNTIAVEDLKPTMFNVSIYQAGASDYLYRNFTEIENDPTRLDTIFLNVPRSEEISIIEFPNCEYYNTYSKDDFSYTIEIASETLFGSEDYDMSLRLDAILLIPVGESEE